MHTCTRMHAQPMQKYILHLDMNVIKIKAKKQQQIYTSEGWKVLVIYIDERLFIRMHY